MQCANGLIDLELATDGKKLQQIFLWSVCALLLVLRYRQEDPDFRAPDASSPEARALYCETRHTLERARSAVTERSVPPQSPKIVGDARTFIDRTGRNPDLIRMIAAEEGAD